jgi:hypothetical protein
MPRGEAGYQLQRLAGRSAAEQTGSAIAKRSTDGGGGQLTQTERRLKQSKEILIKEAKGGRGGGIFMGTEGTERSACADLILAVPTVSVRTEPRKGPHHMHNA